LDAGKGVPSHVTVLSPFVLPEELNGAIEGELGALFAGIEPFSFRLARAARFSGLLYLAPEPVDPFTHLTELVRLRWPEHPPYGGQFSEVVPHLTVVDCASSGLCDDPDTIMDEAERAIVGGIPIEARAGQVWLMVGDGRWSLRARFPLGG
jgi:hypothetical protein